jgi:hypothetical protein
MVIAALQPRQLARQPQLLSGNNWGSQTVSDTMPDSQKQLNFDTTTLFLRLVIACVSACVSAW